MAFCWYSVAGSWGLVTRWEQGVSRPPAWRWILDLLRRRGLPVDAAVRLDGKTPASLPGLVDELVEESMHYDGLHLFLDRSWCEGNHDQTGWLVRMVLLLGHALKAGGKQLYLTLGPGAALPAISCLRLMAGALRGMVSFPEQPAEFPVVPALPPERLLAGVSLSAADQRTFPCILRQVHHGRLAGVALWRVDRAQEHHWDSLARELERWSSVS